MSKLNPIISIYGPTNSGKTAIAIELVKNFSAEIISVDSVQVYKQASIGSNKPEKKILEKYPHHLLDCIEPDKTYSVGSFKKDVLKIISKNDHQNKNSILVGGTMMYFYSLFNGLTNLPEQDSKIRKKLDQQENKLGLKYLYTELKKVDPVSAARIHENDKQRIKRALEIFLITGKSMDQLNASRPKDILGERKFLSFAIIPEDRKKFKGDLKIRFENMISAGLIEETEMLMNKFSKDIPVLKAVGYKQVVEFLENNLSRAEMIERATDANYQLAKRQMTWLNKLNPTETFFCNQSNIIIKILSYL
ncbi:tRNA (adenosine(37)-N6)-dimethylallyltransferase MiaA [SAR86 cluster bacterium]|nr:tRNA (adenosine(37)-N6)-dimethylallyltransferase MiaA [SAR86 cluster bacterium]